METNKQHRFKQEMIAELKKHNSIVKECVKGDDPFHKIKTVTIEYGSVKHHPMGGIMFEGYVNNNVKLTFHYTLNQDSNGNYEISGGGQSSKLDDFTHEEDNNGE